MNIGTLYDNLDYNCNDYNMRKYMKLTFFGYTVPTSIYSICIYLHLQRLFYRF